MKRSNNTAKKPVNVVELKRQITTPTTTSVEGTSSFKKHLKSIRIADKKYNYGEQAALVEYRAMLEMINLLIPIAEKTYKKWPTHVNAVALNNLVDQSREIRRDIRQISDFLTNCLKVNDVLRTHFVQIANSYIQEVMTLRITLLKKVKPEEKAAAKKIINDFAKFTGKFLQESLRAITSEVSNEFLAKGSK